MPLEHTSIFSGFDDEDEIESIDLSLPTPAPQATAITSPTSEGRSLMDELNELLTAMDAIPKSEFQEEVELSELFDYEAPDYHADVHGAIKLQDYCEMPDTCIMVSHNKSQQLIINILQALIRFYPVPANSAGHSGSICIEQAGDYIASNEHVLLCADLLVTLLDLSKELSEDIIVRLQSKSYSITDESLLSKFLCF